MMHQNSKQKIKYITVLSFIWAVFIYFYFFQCNLSQRDHIPPSLLLSIIVSNSGLFSLLYCSYKISDFNEIAEEGMSQLLILLIIFSFTTIMFHDCLIVTPNLLIFLFSGLVFMFLTIILFIDLILFYYANHDAITNLLNVNLKINNNVKQKMQSY